MIIKNNIIYNIKFLISQFQNFQNKKPNLKVQKIWAKCKSKGKIKAIAKS